MIGKRPARYRLVFRLVVLGFFLFEVCAGGIAQQESSQERKDFRGEYNVMNWLERVGQLYSQPMGLELSEDLPVKRVMLDRRHALIREVLDDGVMQLSACGWQLSGGVINVHRKDIYNDPNNFLNWRMPHFKVEKVTAEEARHILQEMVYRIMNPPPPGISGGIYSWAMNPDLNKEKRITIDTYQATVREILNQIVAQEGRAIWLVLFPLGDLSERSNQERAFRSLALLPIYSQ